MAWRESLTVCQDSKQLANRPDRNLFISAWENVFQWHIKVVSASAEKEGKPWEKWRWGKKRCLGVWVCAFGLRGAVISHNPHFPLAGVGCLKKNLILFFKCHQQSNTCRREMWHRLSGRQMRTVERRRAGGEKTTSSEGPLTPKHGSLNPKVFTVDRLQFFCGT